VTIPIAQQIAEVRREIAMRRQVCTKQVIAHKMRQSESDRLIETMEAVLKTLEWVSANADDLRQMAMTKGSQK
jgi:predicted Holliday junction resolvase-like endonuclease